MRKRLSPRDGGPKRSDDAENPQHDHDNNDSNNSSDDATHAIIPFCPPDDRRLLEDNCNRRGTFPMLPRPAQ